MTAPKRALLTDLAPDPERLAVLALCIDHHGVGDPKAEWPNNLLSRRTVVYPSGRIARDGQAIRHSVDPDELDACRSLASDIAARVDGVSVGMGSESGDGFAAFWVVPNVGEPVATKIDASLIERTFAGTIFPLATMTVEPLSEAGVWWSEVEADGDGSPPEHFAPWRAMIAWFHSRPELVDTAFVRIGDRRALWDAERRKAEYPPGTELTGCVLPRLALGLTRSGSLVGLFGYSVQT